MKITFLNDGIYRYASGAPDAVGGAERNQWLLARALVGAGWSVTVGVRGELKCGERKVIDGADGNTGPVKPHAERERYVAWVAMLRQHKRPDVLIEIARKLPAIRFVVCGGPSTLMSAPDYSERIINELRKTANIEYLGQVPPDKAQQLIAEAALLLSTSDTEGFPNTFVQA